MEVTLIKENPDGSADFNFDMTKEEVAAMVRLGIITALTKGIKEAQEKYDPGNNYQQLELDFGGTD